MRSGRDGLYRSRPSGLYCACAVGLFLDNQAASGNVPGSIGSSTRIGAVKVPKCKLNGPWSCLLLVRA